MRFPLQFAAVAACIGAACLRCPAAPQPPDPLAAQFAAPPASAYPHTWWHWINGNISRAGITADLEAMKRVGIAGATIVQYDGEGLPAGPVSLAQASGEFTQFAIREAARLGLQIGIGNCPGWSSSGGPWITPEHGMQMVTVSGTTVEGPAHFSAPLPQPETRLKLYREIGVLAFPATPAEAAEMPAPKVTSDDPKFEGEKAVDGRADTASLYTPATSGSGAIQFEFPRPVEIRTVTVTLSNRHDDQPKKGTIETSADGQTFSPAGEFFLEPAIVASPARRQSFQISPGAIRFLRLSFATKEMKPFQIAEISFSASPALENYAGKADFFVSQRLGIPAATPAQEPASIPTNKILDLSQRTREGRLEWEVPAGHWTILRFGYTPTGTQNRAAPHEGTGLECDKLSREAVDQHWAAMGARIAKEAGPLAGKTLVSTLIDSYEVEAQNWTPAFREEFKKRRGYDLFAYLPVLAGRIVESHEVSERFLWDYRRTVADLFAEAYYGHMAELAHRSGLLLEAEPYGIGPFDQLLCGRAADVPMSEFMPNSARREVAKLASSAAHIYGKPVAGAEAFTARPMVARWQQSPASLKAVGDEVFTYGINALMFHRYAHQPWANGSPGLTMGPWGTNLERTNTWWEQSGAWIAYLARCQYLLRQGHSVADGLVLDGENAPACFRLNKTPGYDYDGCNADVLLHRISVKDGRLCLPDGTSYRALLLPPGKTMTPELLRRIKALVEMGALVAGPKPLRSPSLAGYPACDAEVKALADELWESKKIADRPLGEVYKSLRLPPDFAFSDPAAPLFYNHRSTGEREIYFVSNQRQDVIEGRASFRVAGKTPEFWDPATGQIEPAAIFEEKEGVTTLPLRLHPTGSVFVVFRNRPATNDHPARLEYQPKGAPSGPWPEAQAVQTSNGAYRLRAWAPGQYTIQTARGRTIPLQVDAAPGPFSIDGPWKVTFPPGKGAPPEIQCDPLGSWSEHPEPGVKYFSGTGAYQKEFQIPAGVIAPGQRLYLDLGRVEVLAEVILNGKNLGVLWKPPFALEITGAARPGLNRLEVRVTNLWVNRLIGDEQLPADCQWKPTSGRGDVIAAFPQWFLDGKPSPSGRVAFTTWRLWNKDDKLAPSGLLGPVTIQAAVEREIP